MNNDGNEDECVNCFCNLKNDEEYDYGMDLILCKKCHSNYLEGKLTTDRLSFIKHGNWKINELLGVIEELKDENEELKNEVYRQKQAVKQVENHATVIRQKLREQNKKMRECLEWYACTDNWRDNDCIGYSPSIINDSLDGKDYDLMIGDEIFSKHLTVGGRRARALLKEFDNECI
jgi:DNA-directed RNA polymerase beta subunit